MTGIERRRYLRAAVPLIMSLFETAGIVAAYILVIPLLSPLQLEVWLSPRVMALALAAWLPALVRLAHRARFRALRMERTAADAVNAAGCHALVFLALLYITATPGPHWQNLCVFYALLVITLPALRTLGRLCVKALRRHGKNHSRVVIVGTNETALRLRTQLDADPGFGYRVMAFFDETPGRTPDPALFRGTLDQLEEYVRVHEIDEIFCTLPGSHTDALRTALGAADANSAQYYYVPQLTRYLNIGFAIDTLGNMHVMPATTPPLSSLPNRVFKRALDIAVAGFAALLFPFLYIPVAIAIKLSSPGPVFYRQLRTGHKGKPFNCLKLRTMRHDPESTEAPVEKNDPRVTAVGRFLRHSSIDELPQIFNVLAGQMSIVGPRPHMVSHTSHYQPLISKYILRHTVKPGITGWAQVNGYRGPTDQLWKMQRRVEHDIWYIENWTPLLDIKIIVRTALNILRGEPNAY